MNCIYNNIITILYIERQQIAYENTALSIKNYKSTANIARLLGVDPTLASIVTSTSMSSFIPFEIRKHGTLQILKLGLSTLKWLDNWKNNISGK